MTTAGLLPYWPGSCNCRARTFSDEITIRFTSFHGTRCYIHQFIGWTDSISRAGFRD